MYEETYEEFIASDDTLRVYEGSQLIFASAKDRLLPLMEYIERFTPHPRQVVIFDKIMGNAAALLSIRAGCHEVYSPLGSKLAIDSLERYSIKYHLPKVVPYILNAEGTAMCPMEKLSLGKVPADFYELISD